jgi:hypothetical protein
MVTIFTTYVKSHMSVFAFTVNRQYFNKYRPVTGNTSLVMPQEHYGAPDRFT